MLCFGSLLKGGLNIPKFPLGPHCHGRVGQKMACKFFSISMYDYLRNTCLHYIDELELVLCHPMLWLLHDEPHLAYLSIIDPVPMSFSIYWFSLIYFSVVTTTITTKIPKTLFLLPLLLLPLPPLSYYFATKYFAADIKLSKCGWIDNSVANTWEYS